MRGLSFKMFLERAEAENNKPDYQDEKLENVIKLIETHCKDSIRHIKNDVCFYRGDKEMNPDIDTIVAKSVDSSATVRQSQNTPNFYTVIIDNNPAFKDFPKRGRSFICSTSLHTAANYTGYSSFSKMGEKRTYRIIPYDGVKIGVCDEADIWDSSINLFGTEAEIFIFNSMFEGLKIKSTMQGLEDYDLLLKDVDSKQRKEFEESFPYAKANQMDNFVKELFATYTPHNLGMHSMTTAMDIDKLRDQEVWIGGKVLMLNSLAWKAIHEHFTKDD